MNSKNSNPPPPMTTITTITTSATLKTPSSTSNSKKKFGKNLNKLIKQPTPPPISGLNSKSLYHRSNSSSGSGTSSLVLLSTKKKRSISSGSNASSGLGSSLLGGGGGSNVGSSNNNGVNSGSGGGSNTTHNALVNALSGGGSSKNFNSNSSNENGNETAKEVNQMNGSITATKSNDGSNFVDKYSNSNNNVDSSMNASSSAWGIESKRKEKQQQQQLQPLNQSDRLNEEQHQNQHNISLNNNNSIESNDAPVRQQHTTQLNGISQSNRFHAAPKIAPVPLEGSSSVLSENDRKEESKEDQVEFMKKLAKEKAAKIREEEEKRIQQQKERAALRLKELELKISKKGSSSSSSSRSLNGGNPTGNHYQLHSSSQRRTLFDPSSSTTTTTRTYSSLVGSTSSTSNKHNNAVTRNVNNGNGNRGNLNNDLRESAVLSHKQQSQTDETTPPPPAPQMQVIQLTSYEDRDRGMARSTNIGPRMLFDPKSGSMVAVPSRDREEKNSNSNGNSTNHSEREKGRSSSKARREKGKSKSSRQRKDTDNNFGGTEDDRLDSKANKIRNKSKKDKRRDFETEKKASSGTSNKYARRKASGSLSTQDRNLHGREKKFRLPRTKGVLYKRDENGNFVSADGCEGDQGYGAHSIPGGRVMNPKGYATFQRKLQEESEQYSRTYANVLGNQGFGAWHHSYDYTLQSSLHLEYDSIPSKTLNRSHFMRKNNSPKQTPKSKDEDINYDLPSPLRVKADEKLELLTGMDESPTLQATAAVWAPSEAALALAAANANQNEKGADKSLSESGDDISESEVHAFSAISLIENSTHNDDDDDDEGSQSLRFGLGFDPTKNMDSVMMSPDLVSADNDGSTSINVPELLFKAGTSLSTSSKNPFAADTLLGPSPWGGNVATSVSMGSLSNWDYLRDTGNRGNATAEPSSGEGKNTPRATPFLSLGGLNGDQNTWGTAGFVSGFSGINGPSFGSASSPTSKD
mmetsp:Transcript_20355/g.30572  ORF Transcript_20355/g.30572 Transcript_20355/m.30572 type:complete len:977 (+) Transcript_20355:558-3488(+)|eukprot:CAMPEP_0203669110 /NCGR_PEP_ID=MMETSP0090-20130426/5566_1 /ASSEMBLY_ACC=CAM_ASM_001088 /TAXON_ID=426623 /ORGANISM="Chaetoceros affinis, Strain CCMP159" /LENGTH=976 /DNA_ID=CAMNT_0050533711 /DNA_START=462 /DNA_END=3392 /DNA_ORIENTATION=+